jgi:hypothetical protein
MAVAFNAKGSNMPTTAGLIGVEPQDARLAFLFLLLPALLVFSDLGCAPPPDGRAWLVDETDPTGAAAVEALLERRVDKVDLDGKQFGEAIDLIRKWSGANVYVNWGAMAAVGVDKTATTSVKLANVTIRQVLEKVLLDVGGANPLGFEAQDGILTVSTRDDLECHTVTRVYDIGDLLGQAELKPWEMAAIRRAVTEGLHKPNPGGGLFGTTAPAYSDHRAADMADEIERVLRVEREDELLGLLCSAVGGSYSVLDGRVPLLREFSGKLVVRGTWSEHRHLAQLLAALREQTPLTPPGRKAK